MILKNVSFIVTVFNEEKDITAFLDSIFEQDTLPEEIIMVDGGSTDDTLDMLIRYFQKKAGVLPGIEGMDKDIKKELKFTGNISPEASGNITTAGKDFNSISVKVFQKIGAKISEGRNFAIKNATGVIICVSDCGCVLDRDWFFQMTRPLLSDKNIYAVGGYNYALARNFLQSCLAASIMPKKNQIKKYRYMPSSRNLSFIRSAWAKTGGYPETMDYGEDMRFNFNLRAAGYRIYYNPEALVYWKMRDSMPKIFRQFFRYARGDAVGRMYPHRHLIRFLLLILLAVIITVSAVFSTWFLLALTAVFAAYVFKPYGRINYVWDNPRVSPYITHEKYSYIRKILYKILAVFFIPFLLVYIDSAKLSGYIYGLFFRKNLDLA